MCLHFNGNKWGHSTFLMHGFKCFVLGELLKAAILQRMLGKAAGPRDFVRERNTNVSLGATGSGLGSATDFLYKLGQVT